MKVEYILTPHSKINSKWNKDPNGRWETIKLLGKYTGRTLPKIAAIFLQICPLRQIKKSKYKLDLIKLVTFCTAKEPIKKMKRQHTGELICK